MSLEHSQALERNWERKKPLLQWHAGISPWESWTPRKSLSSMGIRKKPLKAPRAVNLGQFSSQESCLNTFLFTYLLLVYKHFL